MNGVKGNRSANMACLKCFCGSKKHFLLICSENFGNTGNISNICKKNPTLILSKSGWECGAGDRTRTGTPSLAVDFESTTSTIPSHRLIYRDSIHHYEKNSKNYFRKQDLENCKCAVREGVRAREVTYSAGTMNCGVVATGNH